MESFKTSLKAKSFDQKRQRKFVYDKSRSDDRPLSIFERKIKNTNDTHRDIQLTDVDYQCHGYEWQQQWQLDANKQRDLPTRRQRWWQKLVAMIESGINIY